MRTYGRLAKWNDDRGFGFIAPAEGGEEVYVHISAFPGTGGRPRLGEVISFDLEDNPYGKRRAVNVTRPGQRPVARPRAGRTHSERSKVPVFAVIALIAAGAVGAYRYSRVSNPEPEAVSTPTVQVRQPVAPAASKCDGRTMCSQMTSCAEAKYFIQHCPNTKMDGNHDGVPCEQQWCG